MGDGFKGFVIRYRMRPSNGEAGGHAGCRRQLGGPDLRGGRYGRYLPGRALLDLVRIST